MNEYSYLFRNFVAYLLLLAAGASGDTTRLVPVSLMALSGAGGVPIMLLLSLILWVRGRILLGLMLFGIILLFRRRHGSRWFNTVIHSNKERNIYLSMEN